MVHVAKVTGPLTHTLTQNLTHTPSHTLTHPHTPTKVGSLNILPDGRATLEATFTARHRLAGIYVEPDTQGLYYAIPGAELCDDLAAVEVGSWAHGVLNEAVKVCVCPLVYCHVMSCYMTCAATYPLLTQH